MQYQVIAADPPWQFYRPTSSPVSSRSISNHYQTMSLADIKALDVRSLAAQNCVLFLWTIDTHLDRALEVIAAWGFSFRTIGFTWVKTTTLGKYHVGCGWWTRANAEMCLLATRGKPHPQAKDVRRLIVSQCREHSRKPDEAYERMQRLCQGPYVELFARTRREGWDTAFSDQADLYQR